MKRVAYLAAIAAAFFALPIANRYGPFVSVGALVAIGVGLALLASAHANSLSVTGGAFAALGAGVMGATSPVAAGAVFVMLVFAERTLRVRGNLPRAAHVLLCLAGGGMSGAITAMYVASAPLVYAVACATAAVVSGLPLLVDADDPVAHLLDVTASALPQPARGALHDGAELRRQTRDVPLDDDVEKSVHNTWKSLVKLANARAKVEPHVRGARTSKHVSGVVAMLDKRIRDHVTLLSRALTAMDTAEAARLGLDDTALRSVASASDALEATGEAIVDVDVDLESPSSAKAS
jgi:hypothetical protein